MLGYHMVANQGSRPGESQGELPVLPTLVGQDSARENGEGQSQRRQRQDEPVSHYHEVLLPRRGGCNPLSFLPFGVSS